MIYYPVGLITTIIEIKTIYIYKIKTYFDFPAA